MSGISAVPERGQHARPDSGRTPGDRTGFLRLVLGILWISLPLGCSSDNPEQPGPPEPELKPALFFSPGTFCLKGRSGEDTLLVLNQGDAELVWSPIRVPDWVRGLDDEIRLDPDEGLAIPWNWFSPPQAPFSDTVLVGTNAPGHDHVRIILENFLAEPPAHAPPPPLLAFPPDSAVFAAGDSVISLVWQEIGGCAPAEYRVEIASDAGFDNPVFWSDFVSGNSVELLIDRPDDLGRVWWRISPRWVNGILGLPSSARTWLVE